MRQTGSIKRRWWLIAGAAGMGLIGAMALTPTLLVHGLESPRLDFETSRIVVDRNGRLLRPFTTDGGRWRLAVDLGQIDPDFIDMVIAYEDRRFYTHGGVDLLAIARAGWQLVRHGQIVSGASTITMQTARLLGAGESRSPLGKVRQIIGAWQLEERYSKAQILQAYLTLAPYGGNLEGVRAASLSYFGREPRRLTVSQAALLVALPQAPESRRPDRDAAIARNARDRVVRRLAGAGVITNEAAQSAVQEPVASVRRAFPMLAAHQARQALGDGVRRARLTIDAGLQDRLERLAHRHVERLGPKLSAAIVVADHHTGEVLASVGSARLTDVDRGGHLDMTQAVRSPGSTLKPLIYGLAFERRVAHPETLIEDTPVGWGTYRPQNFDRGYRGTVRVSEALVHSLNVPALKLLDAIGPALLMTRLKRAGMKPELSRDGLTPGLAVGLGGVGLRLTDLVRLYGALARNGRPMDLITDPSAAGPSPSDPPPVVEAAAAWRVSRILLQAAPPDNARKGLIAYKTGTSYGFRDAWSVGYDGNVVVGVWVGRPDGGSVADLTGRRAAAPLLFDVFARLGRPITALMRPPAYQVAAIPATVPTALERFRADRLAIDAPAPLQIAYPPDGARVDLGLSHGEQTGDVLAIKIRNGAPPFTWLVDGRPVATGSFRRSISWQPDGPGSATIAVIDGMGRSDRVSVFLQ